VEQVLKERRTSFFIPSTTSPCRAGESQHGEHPCGAGVQSAARPFRHLCRRDDFEMDTAGALSVRQAEWQSEHFVIEGTAARRPIASACADTSAPSRSSRHPGSRLRVGNYQQGDAKRVMEKF